MDLMRAQNSVKRKMHHTNERTKQKTYPGHALLLIVRVVAFFFSMVVVVVFFVFFFCCSSARLLWAIHCSHSKAHIFFFYFFRFARLVHWRCIFCWSPFVFPCAVIITAIHLASGRTMHNAPKCTKSNHTQFRVLCMFNASHVVYGLICFASHCICFGCSIDKSIAFDASIRWSRRNSVRSLHTKNFCQALSTDSHIRRRFSFSFCVFIFFLVFNSRHTLSIAWMPFLNSKKRNCIYISLVAVHVWSFVPLRLLFLLSTSSCIRICAAADASMPLLGKCIESWAMDKQQQQQQQNYPMNVREDKRNSFNNVSQSQVCFSFAIFRFDAASFIRIVVWQKHRNKSA